MLVDCFSMSALLVPHYDMSSCLTEIHAEANNKVTDTSNYNLSQKLIFFPSLSMLTLRSEVLKRIPHVSQQEITFAAHVEVHNSPRSK